MKGLQWAAVIGAAAMASAGAASAHHSAAMFDHDQPVNIVGTVKAFEFTNPHSWLRVMAPAKNGRTVEWGFEAEGPSTLLRAGIKRSSLQPGDKVTVRAYPLKDGRPAGAMITVTKADGTILSARPQAVAAK